MLLSLSKIFLTSANRPGEIRRRRHADHAGPREPRTVRARRCCRTGSPAGASALRPLGREIPRGQPSAQPLQGVPLYVTVVHGRIDARRGRRERSGRARLPCPMLQPITDATARPSRNGIVDFRMMLPSARRSATIAGGREQRFRIGSRLAAAAWRSIGFPPLPLLFLVFLDRFSGGRRPALRENGWARPCCHGGAGRPIAGLRNRLPNY